jgi:hypothetical protein
VIRRVVAALVALVAAFVLSCTSGNAPKYPVAVLMRDSVVMSTDGETTSGHIFTRPACSAFAVAPHELVTAAHCLEPDQKVAKIVDRDTWNSTASGFVAMRVKSVDPVRDLAFLDSPVQFAPLRVRELDEGEHVTAVSAVYDWSKSQGAAMLALGNFRDSSLTIDFGWSGSPVLGDDGAVVGVISKCAAQYVGSLKYCLPRSAIFSLLVPQE